MDIQDFKAGSNKGHISSIRFYEDIQLHISHITEKLTRVCIIQRAHWSEYHQCLQFILTNVHTLVKCTFWCLQQNIEQKIHFD